MLHTRDPALVMKSGILLYVIVMNWCPCLCVTSHTPCSLVTSDRMKGKVVSIYILYTIIYILYYTILYYIYYTIYTIIA